MENQLEEMMLRSAEIREIKEATKKYLIECMEGKVTSNPNHFTDAVNLFSVFLQVTLQEVTEERVTENM